MKEVLRRARKGGKEVLLVLLVLLALLKLLLILVVVLLTSVVLLLLVHAGLWSCVFVECSEDCIVAVVVVDDGWEAGKRGIYIVVGA
jgi:hypothetical protein